MSTDTITLTGVQHPYGGVDAFPLPTSYQVRPASDGETVGGVQIAGWAVLPLFLWAQQVIAVFGDLEHRGMSPLLEGLEDDPRVGRIEGDDQVLPLIPQAA